MSRVIQTVMKHLFQTAASTLFMGAVHAMAPAVSESLFADPLFPSEMQIQEMQTRADQAVNTFLASPSFESAQATYSNWLLAQSYATLDDQFRILDRVSHYNPDAKACARHAVALDQAIRKTPYSLAIVFTGIVCAELANNEKRASQLELILKARLQHLLADARGRISPWPIRMLHPAETSAFVDIQGKRWSVSEVSPAMSFDQLRRRIFLWKEGSDEQETYYVDEISDYYGGRPVGDRVSSFYATTRASGHFEGIAKHQAYAKANQLMFNGAATIGMTETEAAGKLREMFSKGQLERHAAEVALIQLAMLSKAVKLSATDLESVERGVEQKDLASIHALAQVHAFKLIPEHDPALLAALINAARKFDRKGSLASELYANSLVMKAPLQSLMPELLKDAKERRILAYFMLAASGTRGDDFIEKRRVQNPSLLRVLQSVAGIGSSGYREVKSGGEALAPSMQALLDSVTPKLTPKESQRQCDYAEKGLAVAISRCLTWLSDKSSAEIPAEQKRLLRAKLEQANAFSLFAQSEQVVIDAHKNAAHFSLVNGDLDRALMWQSAVVTLAEDDRDSAIENVFLLIAQGANPNAAELLDLDALAQELQKQTGPKQWVGLLANYYLQKDRTKADAALDARCATDDHDACSLLALQQIPALLHNAQRKLNKAAIANSADIVEANQFSASSNMRRDAIHSEINRSDQVAQLAQGKGIQVKLRRRQGEQISSFGADNYKLSPLFLIETREDRTTVATATRYCNKAQQHWECKNGNSKVTASGISIEEQHFLHGKTRKTTCDGKPCRRIEMLGLYTKDLSKQLSAQEVHLDLVGQYLWVDEETNLPIRAMTVYKDWHLYYEFTFDVAMGFSRLPNQCKSPASTATDQRIESITQRSDVDAQQRKDLKALEVSDSALNTDAGIAELLEKVDADDESVVIEADGKAKEICRF
jgi:hypothetical protein